jgi:preprotein translocase subunit SecA
MSRAAVLPTRELALAGYPQRELDTPWPRLQDTARWLEAALRRSPRAALPERVARGLRAARAGLAKLDDAGLARTLPALRARIRAAGLRGVSAGWALGLVDNMIQRRLGLQPYPTQQLAAWLMLDGQFAEMATGEGKTLAAGMAAAAAALAGVPVHLVTANDYLVQRDRAKLEPVYSGLGLTSACVLPAMTRPQREAAYACDIVVLTARELAFDYLRDHILLDGVRDPRLLHALAITAAETNDAAADAAGSTDFGDLHALFVASTRSMPLDVVGPAASTSEATAAPSVLDSAPPQSGALSIPQSGASSFPQGGASPFPQGGASSVPSRSPARGGPRPVLPGLCLALIDEADSVLLDEATVPLILAAPVDAVEGRSYQAALTIARGLRRGRDYTLDAARRGCELNDDGRTVVSDAVQAMGDDVGLLRPLRRAHEFVAAALCALHAMQRDRDYVIVAAKLQLVDEVTGRIADGRQWTGPLQAMVELKEGLAPSPGTRVSAQITYQRFFPRYLRVGGMSGTLREAQRELRVIYDGRTRRVPLAKPDRRQWFGETLFVDTPRRDAALVARVAALMRAGRPVLVGTHSVSASQRVAQRLHAAGVDCQVLNALQDADEAACVARAGNAGVVTVATNMAGRGTDIALDERARAAGGLHVIATMRNRSRRIDRQLIGRAARHGDPGSAESMLALDDDLFAERCPAALRYALVHSARADGVTPAPLARVAAALVQRRAEAQERARRALLRHGDRQADETFAFAGGTE